MRRSKGGIAVAVLLAMGANPARAQDGLIDLVPRQEFTDERGVDLPGSVYRHHEALLRIGNGPHPLALNIELTSPGLVQGEACFGEGDLGNAIYLALNSHAYFGNTAATALYTVVLPHQTAKFNLYSSSGGQLPWIVVPGDDAYVTGSFDSTSSYFSYVGVDGTEATFSNLHTARPDAVGIILWGNADQTRFPDGETWTYRYNDVTATFAGCSGRISRVRSIVSSRGYGIQFDYASDPTGTVSSRSALQDFVSPISATAYNKASVYCDEALMQSCASVAALSSAVTFAYDRANRKVTVVKPNGEQVELTFQLSDTLNLINVTRPGGVTRTMTYENWTEQDGPTYRSLSSLTEAGRTWGYGFSPNCCGSSWTTVNDPSGHPTIYQFQNGLPYAVLDPLNRQTQLGFTGYARFLFQQYPAGNQVTAAYDARGNLNRVQQIPVSGTGSTLQATAVFPSSCVSTDRRSCNRPTSVTDFNGNTTDYTYSPDHGGILAETGPLVPTRQSDGSIVSVRPQKRYEYAQRYAWISNGGGGYVQAAAPVWLLVRERSCRVTAASGSSCAGGAADEIVTDYDYGPNSGPNNLLLRGIAVTADGGSGLVTQRTCYGYDIQGNPISETQPNANLTSCP